MNKKPSNFIIFEDDFIMITNKPSGWLVQATGAPEVDGLAWEGWVNSAQASPAWLCHRIDRGTSGLVLMAKQRQYLPPLKGLFEQRHIVKKYRAWVAGQPTPSNGTWNWPLAEPHQPGVYKKACSHYITKANTTIEHPEYRIPKRMISLLEIQIETGRKHQIRRHCQCAKHPILGDSLYGIKRLNKALTHRYQCPEMCLQGYHLSFIHPFTEEAVQVEIPPPTAWQALMDLTA